MLLQAHLDMVNEKNGDSTHDFEKDGLELILEGNICAPTAPPSAPMTARAWPICWALMDSDSDSFVHPPLEFLFTTVRRSASGAQWRWTAPTSPPAG